jgi:hypothetical protein
MTPKNVEKIHLFAGIAMNGITDLYLFESNLTGEKYAEIIETLLIPEAKQIFGNS